jgi:hypothetical protein
MPLIFNIEFVIRLILKDLHFFILFFNFLFYFILFYFRLKNSVKLKKKKTRRVALREGQGAPPKAWAKNIRFLFTNMLLIFFNFLIIFEVFN